MGRCALENVVELSGQDDSLKRCLTHRAQRPRVARVLANALDVAGIDQRG